MSFRSNILGQRKAVGVGIGDFISYYRMGNNLLDSLGVNNGTPTDITYENSLGGKAAIINGTTSRIVIPDNDSLSFTDGVTDKPFSVVYRIKTTDTKFMIFAKLSPSFTNIEQYCYYQSGHLFWILCSDGAYGNNISQNVLTTGVSTGSYANIVQTYNGLGYGGLKTYIDGALISDANLESGTYTKMMNTGSELWIGDYQAATTFKLTASLDELAFLNRDLTDVEVSEINTKLNSGQSLI
jgi:hypothetical protein